MEVFDHSWYNILASIILYVDALLRLHDCVHARSVKKNTYDVHIVFFISHE